MRRISRLASTILMLLLIACLQPKQAEGARSLNQVDYALLDVTWGQKGSTLEPASGDQLFSLTVAVAPSAVLKSSIRIGGLTGKLTYSTPYITSQDGSSSEEDSVEGIYGLGQRIEFHYTVNLDKNMPFGTYYASLTVRFFVADGSTEEGEPFRLTIPLKILGRADFRYRLEPSVLAPGAVNTLILVVENTGSAPAYSLETTFTAEKTTIVEGNTPWTTDFLSAKGSARIPFTLYVHPDLENRIAKGIVSAKYRSSQGSILTVEKQVSFTVEARRNLFRLSSSLILKSGVENNGTITVTYLGQATLDRIDITLAPTPPATITSTPRWTFYQIRSGGNTSIPLKIFAEKGSRSTTVTATIQYLDPMGAQIKETLDQSFPVEAAPEGSTTLRYTSFTAKAGDTTEVKILLSNTRSSAIRNVNVESQVSQPFSIIGTSTWSFREINRAQEADLPLTLYTPSSALGASGILVVTVRYSDQYGTSSTDTHRIGFVASKKPQEGSVSFEASVLELTAGATNTVSITLNNGRSFELRDSQVTARASDPLKIIGPSSWNLPSVKQSSRSDFTLQLLVPNQASGASGLVTFNIEYSDPFGEKVKDSHSIGFSIPKSTLTTSPLTVSLSNATVKTSSLNSLTLILGNNGGTAVGDIDLKIAPVATGSIIGSEGRWVIRRLDPGRAQSMPFTLFLPEGASSALSLQLDISYSDVLGGTRVESRRISLVVGSATSSSLLVTALGGEVVAGSRSNYTLIVTNTASHTVTDAEIRVEAPATLTIVATEGRWPLGRLMSGEAKKVIVPVFAFDKSVGSKGTLSLSVSYSDEGVLRSEKKSLDFTVVGLIDLRLTDLVFTPHPLPAGSKFTVSGTLFNAGNVEIKASTIRFNVSPVFKRQADAATDALIGDISSGSQTPFSLSGQISPDASPGGHSLKLTASFKDDRGVWRTLELAEEAQVVPQGSGNKEQPAQPLLSVQNILLGTALITVVAVIVYVVKRR